MRIGVLTFEQTPDEQPNHFVSKTLRSRFLEHFQDGKVACVAVSERVIKIRVDVTFGKLKALLKSRERCQLASGKTFTPSSYLPERMPSAEVGGCRFLGPIADPQSTVPRLCHIPALEKQLHG